MKRPKLPIANEAFPKIKSPLQVTTTEQGKSALIVLTIDLSKRVKPQFAINKCQSRPPYESKVEICYNRADFEGKWSWNVVRNWKDDRKAKSLIDNFHTNYHAKKTWQNVFEERCARKGNKRTAKHKSYPIAKITKEALDRLAVLELDDFDEIFRFRLEGKFRFYGFTMGSVFMALWHDPDHAIYPLE